MLNLVASAVSIRYDASTDGQLKERGLDQPVVTIRDAMAAAKATVKTYVDRINGLPEMAKMVLCVAVTLCCNSSSNFTMRDLRKYCLEVATHESLEKIDFDMFKQLVQHLVDQGLLLPNDDETNDIGNSAIYAVLNKPVHFGDQLQDVEIAIADTLEGKPVYKKLIDSIKNLHPRGRATNR
jgi:Cdc6-like AAA superfamily ATPase